MPDNDLNNAQAVTEPVVDLNNADVVNQPDLDAQAVQEQNQELLADGTDANKPIPYDKAKEMADSAKREAEGRATYAERQLELYQANAVQSQQTYVQPKSVYDQALENCGITSDDLFGENIVKFQQEKDKIDNEQRQRQQATMEQQQFVVAHPDVNQVIGSVNPMTGQFAASPELLALLAKKPYLAAACNTQEIAYQLVLQERQLNELQKTQSITQEQQVRQNVDNKIQPLGGSAAGGMGGGAPQGQGLLSREQVLEIEAGLG